MSTERPGLLQKIGYLLGRRLPESMQPWVLNDLTGPGAFRRYFVRGLIPVIPLFAAFMFIPGSVWVKIGMIVLLLIPFVYFQAALSHVFRRHLMVNNGLDPELLNKHKVRRADAISNDYHQRHGR